MPGRRTAAAAEPEEQEHQGNGENGTAGLQFKESLSWRAGKPIPLNTLLQRLGSLSEELKAFEQEEVDPTWFSDVAQELVARNLLAHKDNGVKALTACCLVDVLRLCAPDAPFSASQLNVRAASCKLVE